MRIVFFGSGAFGLPTLAHLASNHQLAGIVTQPDRPAGRGGAMTPTPIGAWAETTLPGVPLLKPDKVNLPEVVARVRAFDADAWVVIAFGQKLGRALLDARFAINLHASLLPRWRGAAPIHAAILAGDPLTGNSVITLADRMDAGLVLAQSNRPLDPALTAGEFHDLLAADGPALIEQVLDRHARGQPRGRAQDESLVTIAPKLSKSDGWIDFADAADACRRRVHGLTPWPGVTAVFRDAPLKLLRVASDRAPADARSAGQPGTLLDADAGLVATGDGLLRLLDVQPAGKRAMAWADFARGAHPRVGEQLGSTKPQGLGG